LPYIDPLLLIPRQQYQESNLKASGQQTRFKVFHAYQMCPSSLDRSQSCQSQPLWQQQPSSSGTNFTATLPLSDLGLEGRSLQLWLAWHKELEWYQVSVFSAIVLSVLQVQHREGPVERRLLQEFRKPDQAHITVPSLYEGIAQDTEPQHTAFVDVKPWNCHLSRHLQPDILSLLY
jgi:hypothetical protein